MENFKELFFNEASELLIKLEESLLQLEENLSDKELVNEVFRVMHSLKGSGSMFGFTNLSSLTHDLENLYDKIRNDELNLNSDIISFTMRTADHITELLKNDNNSDLEQRTNEIKKRIREIINNGVIPHSYTPEKKEIKPEKTSHKNISTYFIKFTPNNDILYDGTNPLYLIDELVDLGESLTWFIYDEIPFCSSLKAEKCYSSWIIILSTPHSAEDIRDVFIFVEEDSILEIEELSNKDLLKCNNAESTLNYVFNNTDHVLEEFMTAAKILEDQISEKDTAPVDLLNDDSKPEYDDTQEHKGPEGSNDKTKTVKASFPSAIQINNVSVSSVKLDTLINLVSELVTTEARFTNLVKSHSSIQLHQLSEHLQLLTRQFRDISFEMRLIPVQTLVVKFKRLVRDLSKELGKEVNFTTEGTDTEMDKSIITTISDPVMHVIRNSIDHGIESSEERIKKGKPKMGSLHFKAYSEGAFIVISIKDDGKGVDKEKVIRKALENDLITTSEELTDDEINNLIMRPGFSTSEKVTDVSGRGVGMDVVRKKIEEIRGEVKINSDPGKGMEVLFRLPLTLSIIDGLLVTVNNDSYIIPLSDVVQIYQLDREKLLKSKNNILDNDGIQYTYLNLPSLFENVNSPETDMHFITVRYGEKIVGLIVNKLKSEYQAVLKPVNKVMRNNEIFAGATILGDGKIAMVFDIHKLIEYYSELKLF